MKQLVIIMISLAIAHFAKAQENKVGGLCEGCEAIYESPVPFGQLKSVVLLPDATWNHKKPLGINGTVYEAGSKTPAAGVVLYFYHTDESGYYPKKGNEKGWAKRHGYIRGWARTDEKGFYKFVTLRPGAYPDHTAPAHIHVVIKEPNLNEYYIDEFVFTDDPLLTEDRRNKLENRGGSGVVKLIDVGNMFKGERNIYLGKNIPNYPR